MDSRDMTEPKRNLLGIPISGDIVTGSTRVEQHPQSQFEDIVRRVLDDPFFLEFGWSQYTPYFNDGEPCEFSAHAPWIRTQDLEEKEDEEEWERDDRLNVDYGTHPTLGGLEYPNGYMSAPVYVGTREAQWKLARELSEAIEGGHFENVLLDLFGDHCEVKVARTGITIDEYSHD